MAANSHQGQQQPLYKQPECKAANRSTMRVGSVEGLAVIAKHGVDILNARFSAEDSIRGFYLAHAYALKQANGCGVPRIGDSEDLIDLGDREDELDCLAHRSCGNAATLGMARQGNANFRVAAFLVEQHTDVTDEAPSVWLGDTDLSPVAWIEKRRSVHFAEERGRLVV